MCERVKERRKVVYFYNPENQDQIIGEEETRYEPTEQESSEFADVVGTLSLPHGQVPPEPLGQWSVYKVYEKVVIWLHHWSKEAI